MAKVTLPAAFCDITDWKGCMDVYSDFTKELLQHPQAVLPRRQTI